MGLEEQFIADTGALSELGFLGCFSFPDSVDVEGHVLSNGEEQLIANHILSIAGGTVGVAGRV